MSEILSAAEITLRRALATLSDAAIALMVRAIEGAYPNEACGFLLESGDVWPAVNVATDPRRGYVIGPEELLAVHRAGRRVVGVFHSHPDGRARPSAADRAQAQAGWTYVIIATRGARISDASSFVA